MNTTSLYAYSTVSYAVILVKIKSIFICKTIDNMMIVENTTPSLIKTIVSSKKQ